MIIEHIIYMLYCFGSLIIYVASVITLLPEEVMPCHRILKAQDSGTPEFCLKIISLGHCLFSLAVHNILPRYFNHTFMRALFVTCSERSRMVVRPCNFEEVATSSGKPHVRDHRIFRIPI